MTAHGIAKLHRLLLISSRSINPMGAITHVRTKDPVVSLTFDGGPHPQWTLKLLDILERYQARATFFMIGKHAQAHPDIVRQVAQAGHAIGNHSWDHPSFPLISGLERKQQIRACAEALAPYGQPLFRPPYGHQSVASRLNLLALRHKVVTWNLHAYDWEDRDAHWMAKLLESALRPGRIVLLHDAVCVVRHLDRTATLEATRMLLESSSKRFRFVTVPELLQLGLPQRKNWYRHPDIEWLKLRQKMGEDYTAQPDLNQRTYRNGEALDG